ncbi:hypothetical protein Tco_0098755 [Tanacetum coccineum]
MVAYLKKPEGSEGFHQIVDFPNASHIRYALTENPTIYVSLIKQFWETATARTFDNGEIELTAITYGKVKIVSEASIRRHLQLANSDGISSLTTSEIFEQLSLMGPKKTSWEQFSSNIATAIICLATNRKFNFSKLIFDGMVKNLNSKHKFLMYPSFIQVFLNKQKRLLKPHTRLYIAPTHTQKLFSNMKRASKGYTGENILLFPEMIVQGPVVQGEGSTHLFESHHTPTSALSTSQPLISTTSRRTNRQESMVPQPRSPTQIPVADEAASTGVDVRYGGATTIIIGLEVGQGSGNIDKTLTMSQDSPLLRVNTLGSDEGSMTLQELMVLCTTLSKKVESLETDLTQTKLTYDAAYTKLIKKVKKLENKVKKIAEIDQDPQHDAEIQGRHEHDMEFNFDLDAAKDVSTAKKDVSTAKPVSTTGAAVTTASVDVSTAKDKGKAEMDESESETTQTKIKLQQEQERLGYEVVVRLQAELEEEERQRIARKLQAEEREMYTEAEQVRMLVELINQRKRYFAAQRAKERRNKPPIQAQQRTYMSNYIKHIGGYTLQQLRGYSFDEIKNLFETTMRRVHTFVPIESKIERVISELAAEVQKEMQKKNLIKKVQRDKRLVKAQNQLVVFDSYLILCAHIIYIYDELILDDNCVIIMAQQQHVADVHPDELCPPNKRYDLIDANKKVDLKHVQCPPECKILTNINQKFPFRSVLLLLLPLYHIYMATRQSIHVPQANANNHDSFVPPPSFLDMVPFYKEQLGFTMELKTSSSFKKTGILHPWQMLCKIFSKCLTTRVTGWDQPPLQIMQMMYCFVNNIHVDYAELL